MTSSAPARLTVSRRLPRDVRTRQVTLALDGQYLATLMFGDTYSGAIAPGHHSLRFNNTLVWKTIEFDVAPGEEVRFAVLNRTGWGTWWMITLFGAGPLYLTVVRQSSSGRP